MRTDRHRVRQQTRKLLDFEVDILESKDSALRLGEVLKDIRAEIDPLVRASQTSREIDSFLQLAMLYVSVSCYRHYRFKEGANVSLDDIKVLTSVFYRSPARTAGLIPDALETIVVKPSCHFPGFCAARQPTIDLQCPREDEDDPIGIAGLALFRGEIVHCSGSAFQKCPTQFNLRQDEKSSSLIYLPLGKRLKESLTEFLGGSHETQEGCSWHCCLRGPEHRQTESTDVPEWVYGVLGVEATVFSLDRASAIRWLRSDNLESVLLDVAETVRSFQEERPQYKVHRAWSVLDGLRGMKPERRHTLEIACLALSRLCLGADITLHLREFFPDPAREYFSQLDQKRSARLVLGVGPRVRGFLIHERYEGGLVGSVLDPTVDTPDAQLPKWLSSEEIDEVMAADERFRTGQPGDEPERSYRVLMRDTVLNVAVPILFSSRTIGAINIEWSQDTAPSLDVAKQGAYVKRMRPVFARVAKYLCLIVDFLDDYDNPKLSSVTGPLEDPIHQTHHALALRYYASSLLKDLHEKTDENYLDQVIKNVGYQVTFDDDLRVLASIRRLNSDSGRESLKIFGRPHGIDSQDDLRAEDLWLDERDSVLIRCQRLGVPIFGPLRPGTGGPVYLEPDPLCLDLIPTTDRSSLSEPIPYLAAHPANSTPVFEVGIPIMFGSECLGTFDFELFSAGNPTQSQREVDFNGRHLRRFLDWARFFSYFLAHREDLESRRFVASSERVTGQDDGLTQQEAEAFADFKQVVALVLFGVPTEFKVLKPIVETYLRSIIPLEQDGIRFEPHDRQSPSQVQRLGPYEEGIWHGNDFLGRLDLRLVADRLGSRSVFPRVRQTSGIVTKTRSQVRNLIGDLHQSVDSVGDRRLIDGLRAVARSLQSHLNKLSSNEWRGLDPFEYIHCLFSEIHERLRQALEGADPERYGLFVYSTVFARTRGGEKPRWFFRCGSEEQRWIYMRTPEAEKIASAIVKTKSIEAFRRLFVGTRQQSVAEAWLVGKRSKPLSQDLIYQGISEILASREITHPKDPDLVKEQIIGDLSLTRRIAASPQDIRAIPDLNRNPFRSERMSGWFFGNEAYALIGVPIQLYGECIGMLQVFRRRDYLTDLGFFKIEEIEPLEEIKGLIESSLHEQLELVSFTETSSALWLRHPVKEVCDRIKDSLERFADSIPVVEVPFVMEHDFLKELGRRYFGDYVVEVLSCMDADWNKDEAAMKDQSLVFLTCPVALRPETLGPGKRQELLMRIGALTREHRVVFFFYKGETEAIKLLPATRSRRPISYSEEMRSQIAYLGAKCEFASESETQVSGILVRSGRASAHRLSDLAEEEVDYVFDNEREHSIFSCLENQSANQRITPHWLTYRQPLQG